MGARQQGRYNKPPEDGRPVIDAWVAPMAPHTQLMRLGGDGPGDRSRGRA